MPVASAVRSPDRMPDFEFLSDRLRSLALSGRLRELIPRTHAGTALIHPDGTRLINFGSNDYLGLAAQTSGSSSEIGSGSGASSLVSGWTDRHQLLADQIAEFEQAESAVVFPSGYAACCGTVATLADHGDLILSDALNHASLIDGCRLSRAQRIIYPHGDWKAVADLLVNCRRQFNRVWMVTDGVFGMDGHIAPLDRLTELATEFDAHLIVDEAHGTGVIGTRGQGAGEALGVKLQIPITIGTLSKAIGAQGGFVAGPKVVIDTLINLCRTLIYSTSLAPSAVTAAIAGLQTISDEPDRRLHLQQLARRFRKQLSIDAPDVEAAVPIIPVVIGQDAATVAASKRLAELGFYVPAIRPPTVPEGTGRLRVSLSAVHDPAMVDSLADAIGTL